MSIDPHAFKVVADFVYRNSAIVLEVGKEYLVESRLAPLARDRGYSTVEALVADINKPGIGTAIVEAMTTNETSFFRDIHPFEALKTTIIPQLMKAHESERRLNIWCGAASSGQEPYSLALLLRENFPTLASWQVKIIATDISDEMIQRCREGRYSQLEMNRGLPANLLIKYFTKHGTEWQIDEQVRKGIEFKLLNLSEQWPQMPQLDIVFMRNVLIYFDVEQKRAILGKIRRLLRPGGILFLGSAETTFNLDDGFERIAIDRATAYTLKES
jgi:chemotaxis protein methyltransferase CheR